MRVWCFEFSQVIFLPCLVSWSHSRRFLLWKDVTFKLYIFDVTTFIATLRFIRHWFCRSSSWRTEVMLVSIPQEPLLMATACLTSATFLSPMDASHIILWTCVCPSSLNVPQFHSLPMSLRGSRPPHGWNSDSWNLHQIWCYWTWAFVFIFLSKTCFHYAFST